MRFSVSHPFRSALHVLLFVSQPKVSEFGHFLTLDLFQILQIILQAGLLLLGLTALLFSTKHLLRDLLERVRLCQRLFVADVAEVLEFARYHSEGAVHA